MPEEYLVLKDKSQPLTICPVCGKEPFESFLRGQVQRRKFKWFFWGRWKYCAIICHDCQEVVGWE